MGNEEHLCALSIRDTFLLVFVRHLNQIAIKRMSAASFQGAMARGNRQTMYVGSPEWSCSLELSLRDNRAELGVELSFSHFPHFLAASTSPLTSIMSSVHTEDETRFAG